jgi:beta-glucosidase
LEKLKWYDPVHRQWKLEKTEYTVYTGSSEAPEDLKSAKICLGE